MGGRVEYTRNRYDRDTRTVQAQRAVTVVTKSENRLPSTRPKKGGNVTA